MYVRRKHSVWRRGRRGATTVEFALVGSTVMLLLIGFAALAMGTYRYQQVAALAREGARYASVHGAQHRVDQRLAVGDATIWTQDIRENSVEPFSSALDPAILTVSASWSAGDNRANAASAWTGFTSTIDNAVTVTVSYQWFPEAYLAGPVTLTSTATVPMAY